MKTVVGDQLDPGRGGLFDRKHRFTVKFVVPFDRLAEFVDAVKPYSSMIFDHGHKYARPMNQSKGQDSRIKFLKKCLAGIGWVRIGSFYRRINHMGYLYSFKTLQRDVCVFGVLGLVDLKKSVGGKHGNTTIIRLKENGACSQVPVEQAR